MLSELSIQDFAIIERLVLEFEPGLVVFTGETGAGKSIIFDAVEALLGGRADAASVRGGADRALIEATFKISPEVRRPILDILQRENLLDDDKFLLLAREIRSAGRSIARINGRTVNVSLLRELGEYLIDLHGQSEHLSLLRTREHLGLLDRFADITPAVKAYSDTYKRLLDVRRRLKELLQAEKDAERRLEMLTFQINEIESSRLKPGEEEELRAERTRLANAEGLANAAQEALQALDEGSPESPSIIDLLGKVTGSMQNLQRLDPTRASYFEQASGLFDQANDLIRELRIYLEDIEFNPPRLDFVEERLNLFQTLKRKYGSSVAEVLAFAEKAQQDLENIQHAGERIAEFRQQEQDLLRKLAKEGLALSELRQKAAGTLSKAIQTELGDLRMEGAQFRVEFTRRADPDGLPVGPQERVAFDANGLETVEFMIAPNPGEGFKPLVRIASGGETSRLMLALKNVLARADTVPTLIFDEIDQGIGGRVGVVVGQKLWVLGRQHQVLCITHLPQLAAFGDQHVHVEKLVHDGRTTTRARLLGGENRIVELAQMFGEVSDGTLRSAREILQTAQKTVAAG